MDDWVKLAIAAAAGTGLLMTGGAAAPVLAPLLGAEAAAAGAAGAAGAGAAATGAAATGAAATGATAVGGLGGLGGAAATAANIAPTATGAMSYVTPSLLGGAESATAGMASLDAIAASQPGFSAAGTGALEGLAAANPGYAAGGETALNGLASDQAMGGFGGYMKDAGKAASTYNQVSGAGAPQQGMPPPAPRPVFQGEAPQIAQQQQAPMRGGNEFARMMLEQSMRQRRGMLG